MAYMSLRSATLFLAYPLNVSLQPEIMKKYTLPHLSQIGRVTLKNKNTSLGPFNGWEHQNTLSTETSFRAILCDVKRAEGVGGREAAAPIKMFPERK